MRPDGLLSRRGLTSAAILLVAAVLLAWVCVRSAMIRVLPPRSPTIARIAPGDPGAVLANASVALVRRRGILDPATLAAVLDAAQAAPLDARPYLILGHQQLLDNQPQRAVRTFEAGQRLDPRERLIHLLLLDRYLRTGRFADAATQFAISARLVGSAQGPIAAAIAQMVLAPQTRDAVRRTLSSDPVLERSVLAALANSDTPPSAIIALASPVARRDASNAGSWGSVLIARMVNKGHYVAARAIWRDVYGLNAAQIAPPVFDAGFHGLPGSPPFNWTLVADSRGAADIRDDTLTVNYYGRDTGELARQLLVLSPGVYRFGITVDGSKTGAGPLLSWSLRCATGSKAELMSLAAVATGVRHRVGAGFTVPAGCPAQQLMLIGNAGEFPAPINLTLRDLDIRPATAGARR